MNKLNLIGMRCPLPLMKTQRYCRTNELTVGDRFEVLTDDPESIRDFRAYFEVTKNYTLIKVETIAKKFLFIVEKVGK